MQTTERIFCLPSRYWVYCHVGGFMKRFSLIVFLAAVAFACPALAQGNGMGNGNGGGHSKNATQGTGTGTVTATVSLISAYERSTILGYVQNHQSSFSGMQPLPPGIAKKVARGGSLPPGIAKRYFPNDLLGQLPARPGQQWMFMGTDVVLLNTATQLILDVLHL